MDQINRFETANLAVIEECDSEQEAQHAAAVNSNKLIKIFKLPRNQPRESCALGNKALNQIHGDDELPGVDNIIEKLEENYSWKKCFSR